jgi:acetyl-CoA C-acetyltransferase
MGTSLGADAVVVVGAVRTAIGRLGGTLAERSAVQLGATVIGAALARSGVGATQVDEVIMGHVLQAGCGLNPARQAALQAGLAVTVPAYTVNKVCASGLKAVALGCQAVAAGDARVVVAGGMESMSSAPFLLRRARWGYRLGDDVLADAVLADALQDPGLGYHMGVTAENLADDYQLTRQAQDEFAARSQNRAAAARSAGCFTAEVVPVEITAARGPSVAFTEDEFIRPDTTAAGLARLKPAFRDAGTVTAGNSSGINDGAAAVVLTTAEEARRHGWPVWARIVSHAAAGVEPSRMGLGPVPAVRRALQRAGLSLDQVDLWELNEAFAAQALAVIQELGADPDRVNVHGGAIALGHPVGASGARILVTLLHALTRRQGRYGVAALCVGGGQGLAVVVERRS